MLFEEFLDKISPLRTAKKLGAILFQLPPSFTVKNIPTADGYDYAVEFRHHSWGTEGPWEMLRHYNIAAVMTDSPPSENLQFLSDVIITANHSLIRFHGRNTKGHYWYNYLYSEQELKPWVEEVNERREQTKILRIYFNNHYGGKAVINAMEFKEMIGVSLSADEKRVMKNAKGYILGN